MPGTIDQNKAALESSITSLNDYAQKQNLPNYVQGIDVDFTKEGRNLHDLASSGDIKDPAAQNFLTQIITKAEDSLKPTGNLNWVDEVKQELANQKGKPVAGEYKQIQDAANQLLEWLQNEVVKKEHDNLKTGVLKAAVLSRNGQDLQYSRTVSPNGDPNYGIQSKKLEFRNNACPYQGLTVTTLAQDGKGKPLPGTYEILNSAQTPAEHLKYGNLKLQVDDKGNPQIKAHPDYDLGVEAHFKKANQYKLDYLCSKGDTNITLTHDKLNEFKNIDKHWLDPSGSDEHKIGYKADAERKELYDHVNWLLDVAEKSKGKIQVQLDGDLATKLECLRGYGTRTDSAVGFTTKLLGVVDVAIKPILAMVGLEGLYELAKTLIDKVVGLVGAGFGLVDKAISKVGGEGWDKIKSAVGLGGVRKFLNYFGINSIPIIDPILNVIKNAADSNKYDPTSGINLKSLTKGGSDYVDRLHARIKGLHDEYAIQNNLSPNQPRITASAKPPGGPSPSVSPSVSAIPGRSPSPPTATAISSSATSPRVVAMRNNSAGTISSVPSSPTSSSTTSRITGAVGNPSISPPNSPVSAPVPRITGAVGSTPPSPSAPTLPPASPVRAGRPVISSVVSPVASVAKSSKASSAAASNKTSSVSASGRAKVTAHKDKGAAATLRSKYSILHPRLVLPPLFQKINLLNGKLQLLPRSKCANSCSLGEAPQCETPELI